MSDSIKQKALQDIKQKKIRDAVQYKQNKEKLEKYIEADRVKQDLNNVDLTTDWLQQKIQAEEDSDARDNAVPFLFSEASDFVQLSAGSLAVFLAATGTGKSTFSANIAHHLKSCGKRTLIIVNEERSFDMGARIACLDLGVDIHKYKKKGALPKTVKQQVFDHMATFGDLVTVIGLDFKGNSKLVTSPEGMDQLLTVAQGKYDAILIDYYQNVNYSINNPNATTWEAMEKFSHSLDKHKNTVDCPIMLFAQVRRGEEYYKDRIEGRKIVLNKATDVFEIQVDKKNQRSAILCHKDRWLGNHGEDMFVGYDKGKFVPYTPAFEDEVRRKQIDALSSMVDEDTGVTDVALDEGKAD